MKSGKSQGCGRSSIPSKPSDLSPVVLATSPTAAERPNPAAPDGLNGDAFLALLEQTSFYLLAIAPDGRVTNVGQGVLQASGYPREEVMGRLFWQCPWWKADEPTQRKVEEVFRAVGDGDQRADWRCVKADRQEQWIEYGLCPVRDATGAIRLVVAMGTDITRRIQTERELGTIRRRLDSALMAAEIGTYQWDVLGDRLFGDRNLAQLFGISLGADGAAPIGEFLKVIHDEDRARVAGRVQHSMETGENFAEDYRIVRRGGTIRWVNSRGRMVRDPEGRVVTFFGLVLDITDRKRAEQEREVIAVRLRRLTAIHETVLSGIKDFAYVFDLQGRFLYANRPLLELYGRTLEDVVGKTFSQLGYPAWHAEMHLREIAEVIATKKPIQGEIPFRGESGNSGIFDYIFVPVFGAEGSVEVVAGTTRDVTDRKRSEVRDRLLVSLDDATRPLTDPEAITRAAARLLGEYLGVNRCAYADVEEDQNSFNLTGDFNRDVPSIVGRYRFDQFGAECLRLMRAGSPYVVEDAEADPRTAAVRDSYRATQICSVICVPLLKDGRFVAAMAVHQNTPREWRQHDVESVLLVASRCWESIERTRVIRVLAESEQRLSLAIATGRLGVWQLDLPSRRLTISSQGRSIHGRGPAEAFTYDDLLGTVHPRDQVRLSTTLERSISTCTDFDIEYRVAWPDGGIHWVLVRGQTSEGPDLRPHRTIGVCLDITARKEAEREQVRLREEAVRASRAKDDFLATLSHELRTPLNPILLIASEAVDDASLPEAARESFDIIRRNVELEARLIDDLLDLTSIVRGKLTIRKEPHDLHAILGDAIAAVQPTFQENAIMLNLKLAARKPGVFVDEVRMVQVFINLLKNSAKFTPPGGTVTLETLREENGVLLVRIADTGIGLTAVELERVFDAFEQGEHAREDSPQRFGGLGLGLAIAQQLAQLHGGSVSAASEGRGRGATFSVRLPGCPTLPMSPPGDLADQTARGPAEAATDGARILLVEDHEATRTILKKLLENRKYVVAAAESLAEARSLATEAAFDIVVSDLGLPDGDGTLLMAELRDRHGLTGIALTGFGMDADIARCHAAGFISHLTKPVGVRALYDALRGALRARTRPPENPLL